MQDRQPGRELQLTHAVAEERKYPSWHRVQLEAPEHTEQKPTLEVHVEHDPKLRKYPFAHEKQDVLLQAMHRGSELVQLTH